MQRGVFSSILETVGHTPIIRLQKIGAELKQNFYVKVEYFNPGSSVKDRIAIHMIEEAERRGELKPGGTIVEATSGNTGMGLALVAAVKGYRAVFVMPDKMSIEKIQALRAFGARVVVTPTNVEPEDPRSYYEVSKRIARETPNSFYANQYHNPDNPLTHYKTTGPEIWDQTQGKVTAFIAGMGTGGTITGVSKFLKEKNPNILVVGVDPEGSVFTEFKKTGKMGKAYSYKVEGVGEDFMPSTIDFRYIDEVSQVSDRESLLLTRKLARQEGLFVGGSCGLAVAGALKFAQHNPGKLGDFPVILLPDNGSRYLSKVYNDDWMRENGFLDERDLLVRDVFKRGRLLHCSPTDLAKDCITAFRETGVSQMPVINPDGSLFGIITESDLIDAIWSGSANLTKAIAPFVIRQVETVSLEDPLRNAQNIVKADKVPVVMENGKVIGVITKIDLLDFYAERTLSS